MGLDVLVEILKTNATIDEDTITDRHTKEVTNKLLLEEMNVDSENGEIEIILEEEEEYDLPEDNVVDLEGGDTNDINNTGVVENKLDSYNSDMV